MDLFTRNAKLRNNSLQLTNKKSHQHSVYLFMAPHKFKCIKTNKNPGNRAIKTN